MEDHVLVSIHRPTHTLNDITILLIIQMINRVPYVHMAAHFSQPCCYILFVIDIDECASENGDCDHECVNLLGTHLCRCRNGFTSNGPGCMGKNTSTWHIQRDVTNLTIYCLFIYSAFIQMFIRHR